MRTQLVHLSIDTDPGVAQEAAEKLGFAKDPIEALIELEEELGCSIAQAVKRYRDMVSRTVDTH